MSTITAETILKLIEQLPSNERTRLDQLLAEQPTAPPQTKPPRDKRVPCEPQPDRTLEWEWIKNHQDEYAGQWVALEGDRLVAARSNRMELSEALKLTQANRPLIHRMASPDDLPYIGI